MKFFLKDYQNVLERLEVLIIYQNYPKQMYAKNIAIKRLYQNQYTKRNVSYERFLSTRKDNIHLHNINE